AAQSTEAPLTNQTTLAAQSTEAPLTNQTTATLSTEVPLTNQTTLAAQSTEAPLTNQTTATLSTEAPLTNQTTATLSTEVPLTNQTTPLPEPLTSLQFNGTDASNLNFAGDASVTEQSKTSLALDGQADYVQVSSSNSTRDLASLTISAWIKPDYSNGSPEFTLISEENTFVLALNNNIPTQKIAKFSVFDGIIWHTVESTSQIKEEWTHLAATFGDSAISIYINGNLEATLPIQSALSIMVDGKSDALPVDSISSGSDIVIGAYLNSRKNIPINQFSGLIDGVLVYDSLLLPSQITQIYNQDMLSYHSAEKITDLSLIDDIKIGTLVPLSHFK
ncbi:MAG: LamG-like jellyroll fold domain-containing protein, partial [Nitrososphaerales archaeon]